MIENKCVFCDREPIRQRIIWEDDLFYSLFDAYPVSPGHCLVIPKRHVIDALGMSNQESSQIFAVISEVMALIKQTDLKEVYLDILKNPPSETAIWFLQKALANPNINGLPDGYNFGINDGRAAGRTVDHLHLHILPRFDGDVDNPLGGVRFVIPEMGNYKKPR